ncbi:MAG: hypothetical protein M1510_07410 [Nitrospirae bacterium]|nr:hypothetical protein [Nitrospirota bacterium]
MNAITVFYLFKLLRHDGYIEFPLIQGEHMPSAGTAPTELKRFLTGRTYFPGRFGHIAPLYYTALYLFIKYVLTELFFYRYY